MEGIISSEQLEHMATEFATALKARGLSLDSMLLRAYYEGFHMGCEATHKRWREIDARIDKDWGVK